MNAQTREQWIHDFLGVAGFPPYPANVDAVAGWIVGEWGSYINRALWNPLDTTQEEPAGAPDSGDLNTVGVEHYADEVTGLAMTIKTLRNGRYDPIIHCLSAGNDAEATVQAVADSPWGTGQGAVSGLRQVRGNRAFYYDIPIGGAVGISPDIQPPAPIVALCTFTHPTLGTAAAAVTDNGAVFCDPANAYMGGPNSDPAAAWEAGSRHGVDIKANPNGAGYVIEDSAGETYTYAVAR
jgi:hypothetical protein